MNPFAGAHAAGELRIGQGTHLVGSGAGRIDRFARPDSKITAGNRVFDVDSGELALRVVCETDDSRVVQCRAGNLYERFDQREVVASIVKLPVGIGDGA